MESREILPIVRRNWATGTVNGDIISSYHKALEAAEKQIEQLQECNQMWIKAGGESTATIIKLQEENNRLKGLLKEIKEQHEIRVELEDGAELPGWAIREIDEMLEKNNIKL